MDQEIKNEFKSLREFLKDNMVSKQDLKELVPTLATKDDLLELATKTDLSSLRNDIAEVKQAIEQLKTTEDQDVRGAFRDIASLKKRVSALEHSSAHR